MLNNLKVIAKVYETTNYAMFRKLEANRDLLKARLDKIRASISEKYILNPIICNEKMEIIDGQGRFEARKELGVPIHFIIVQGANVQDCRRLNTYNTKWNALDYCKSWAKSKKSYVTFLESCTKHKLSVTRCLRLAGLSSHTTVGHKNVNVLMSGQLDFDENDAKKVEQVLQMGNEIIDALLFDKTTNDAFWRSVYIITSFKGYDHKRMIRNCQQCRTSYVQTANIESQLKEFERIYNYKAKSKLFFSDYMRNKGANVRAYDQLISNQFEHAWDADVSTLR